MTSGDRRSNKALKLVHLFCAAAAITIAAAPVLMAAEFHTNEKVEVREGDSWSHATVLKKEGRKYFIHYADSSSSDDEWVWESRMRLSGTGGDGPGAAATPSAASDVSPAAAATPAAPPAASPAPATPAVPEWRQKLENSHEMFPLPPDLIPETIPSEAVSDNNQVAATPTTWSVKPDPAKHVPETETYDLNVRDRNARMNIDQILPCAHGGAVLGFDDFGGKSRLLQRVGAQDGSTRAMLPGQCLPLAASPDGSVVICRSNKFGTGNNSRIDAFYLQSGFASMKPFVSFTPYAPNDSGERKPRDVVFAAALSNTRIITSDSEGRVVAWDIHPHSVTGIWSTNIGSLGGSPFGAPLALSPGGKWLVGLTQTGVTFIDSTTGTVLGAIKTSDTILHQISCSPNGATVVVLTGDDLTSFDVATGQQNHTVALPDGITFGEMTCPADGYALLRGNRLIDTRTGAFVQQYKPKFFGGMKAVTGPGVTLLATDEKFAEVHIPDTAVRKAVSKKSGREMLLKPDMHIALDINVDMSQADRQDIDTALRQKLTADGFTIDPSAKTKVICRTGPGAQHEHYFAKVSGPFYFAPPGSGTSMILTDKITSIAIVQNGNTIWKKQRENGPIAGKPIQKGQTLQQAVEATIKYDPGFLKTVQIPPYIASSE